MQFIMSNDQFATAHFPEKPKHFFLPRPLEWREYIERDFNKPKTWGSWNFGWSKISLKPDMKELSTYGDPEEDVRFIFNYNCHHMKPPTSGSEAPYYPFLLLPRPAGNGHEMHPLAHDNSYYFWRDVKKSELGKSGQNIQLVYVDKLDGNDARGLTPAKYEAWKNAPGGKSWSYQLLARWELS
jgi:hypothetical protein